MSTNESAPKRERLLVKLDDLQNYNNADHAKRDAFRREFAKRAFGSNERVGDDGAQLSDDQLAGKLDAKLKPNADMTIEEQQALYDSASNKFSTDREAAARQQRHNEAVARHTADTPPATPELNPADATSAPAEVTVDGSPESADQTSEIEGNSLYNRAGSYFQLAKMDGAGKLKRYFSVGSTKHQNKLAALTAERA
ncbi:MAG: hypothetical protein EOO88_44020, partial [Pedobacter sp.]